MGKHIKILYTIPNFDTAGSGKVVYDLVKGLDKNIFAPEICCFHTKGTYFKMIETLDVPIHIFNFTAHYKPFITLPFRILKIARFFRKHHFQLIHSWHWSSDFTEPLAAKLAGIPFIYTKKAMGWGNKAWVLRSKLSTKIISINKDMNAFFKSMPEKVVSIPLGVDIDYFKPLEKCYETPEGLHFSADDFVIVTVANLAPVKGIEVLLDAVRLLNDPKVTVLHVGASDSTYSAHLKATYGNDRGVYFLGKHLDVRPYLAVADVFVIPTKDEGRKEGLPIAPLEAMACGRIVVGSNISGIKDILCEFEPYLFEANNSIALAGILETIIHMPEEKRTQLKKNMRDFVQKSYSLNRFVKRHEDFYKEIIFNKINIK